jgi:hypothetical protein
VAPCILVYPPTRGHHVSLWPANGSRINPRARSPDPGRRRSLPTHTHTHTHTHIGSSETAGLRRWRLPGGKSSLARQAHASALTFINFDFNLRSCQVHTVLTHSHQRLTACCQQRLHVTLSHPRQLSSFTRSQASSFPLRRFKTTTDHVPASHSIRHSLRRFTPVLHFRALLRLGLSVA